MQVDFVGNTRKKLAGLNKGKMKLNMFTAGATVLSSPSAEGYGFYLFRNQGLSLCLKAREWVHAVNI